MTETQRLIENERALDLAKQEVAKVESEISRLGRLEEDLHECRESIEKLLAENTKIRINQDAIDKTKRMARLRDNAATIDLETGDAKRIESDIVATKARILADGEIARASCASILWSLVTARQENARAAFEEILALRPVATNTQRGAGELFAWRSRAQTDELLFQRYPGSERPYPSHLLVALIAYQVR